MRLLITIMLCLIFILTTGCAGKSEGDIGASENDILVEGKDTLETNNQENEKAGEGEQEVPREVSLDDLGSFQKGLSLGEMNFDKKYQDIVSLFKQNLTAWASKDRKAFRECFISEDVADSHIFLLEDTVEYEFVGTPYIIDQSTENGRINIVFNYRTSDQVSEIKGNTTTFTKGEDDIWKIALID